MLPASPLFLVSIDVSNICNYKFVGGEFYLMRPQRMGVWGEIKAGLLNLLYSN